jgi:hypothetical protein
VPLARALSLALSILTIIVGSKLENGKTELVLNPSCVRYLSKLHALFGKDSSESRLAVRSVPSFSPVRVREIQSLLNFLGDLKLLKVCLCFARLHFFFSVYCLILQLLKNKYKSIIT